MSSSNPAERNRRASCPNTDLEIKHGGFGKHSSVDNAAKEQPCIQVLKTQRQAEPAIEEGMDILDRFFAYLNVSRIVGHPSLVLSECSRI